MNITVGIDTGTQSTKVVFYDYDKKQIAASASAAHELISGDDGTREQKAEWWIDAIISCFSQVPAEIKQAVRAIGVSGQQHGFVPMDAEGAVLRPVKLWCDTSTAVECDEITDKFGGSDKLLNEPGNLVLPGYTASKILWFRKNHPDLYKKMAKILLPHDYINWYLTSEYTMEAGDASGTALLNVRTCQWNEELLHALDSVRDLKPLLPKIVEAGEPAGYVTVGAAAALGIPTGIPVSCGGGDNMMGAIGTGTVEDGFLTMSLGTSGTIYGYSDTPIIDTEGYLAAFCSSTGGWLPLLCTMNCTVASEQTRALFRRGVKEFDAIAEKAPAGANGVMMLPFFNGERTPNFPNGKACIVGMDNDNMTEENIARAAMESAIFGLKMGLDSFIRLGFSAREVRLIGGGANSPLWRQIAADILNLPITVPEISEAAALGGAVQAIWTIKILSGESAGIKEIVREHVKINETKTCLPNPETTAVYEKVYEDYSAYVDALSGLFS
ncbi:MAG: xylulokinase [Spirochaetales bacterium]|nr:xylulokinase [Spirochaetales bacterium]